MIRSCWHLPNTKGKPVRVCRDCFLFRTIHHDITALSPSARARAGIGRAFQLTNLFPRLSVLENVRIAAQSRHHGWSLWRHHLAYRDLVERSRAVLASIGLAGKEDELAANLSHGEQRNLEIGIALATEPKLLCLDEPTAGMSAAETHDTMQLVRCAFDPDGISNPGKVFPTPRLCGEVPGRHKGAHPAQEAGLAEVF